MLRIAAGQARHAVGRLVAAGLAIVLAAAFLTMALLTGAAVDQGTREILRSRLGGADLVLTADMDGLTPEHLRIVRGVDGVRAADAELWLSVDVTTEAGSRWMDVATVPTDPGLLSRPIVDGRHPADPDEAALSATAAEDLGLTIGDEVTAQLLVWGPTGEENVHEYTFTVVGFARDLPGVAEDPQPAITLVDEAAYELLTASAEADGSDGPVLGNLLVRVEDGADVATVESEVRAALEREVQVTTLTADRYVEDQLQWFTGTSDALTVFTVTFGALAMVVAGLVIGNTFQVLVAQRTRTLALLRCIGATRQQVRRSVTIEALGLGLVAGPVGVLVGYGILLLALQIWGGAAESLGVALPTFVTLTPLAAILPVAVAVIVTLLASLAPARLAGRVAPLAAMRPPAAPSMRRGSALRKTVAITLTVLGLAAIVGALVLAASLDPDTLGSEVPLLTVMLLLVLGGGLLAGALMAGLVFVVPAVAGLLGRLLAAVVPRGRRAAVRLGTANTVRNPHRTAATAMALVIGVTLVTVVTTGATTVRASLMTVLGSVYHTDIVLYNPFGGPDGQTAAIDPSVARSIAELDGVSSVSEVTEVWGLVESGGHTDYLAVTALTAEAVDASGMPDTELPEPGELLLPAGWFESWDLVEGDTVRLYLETTWGYDGAPPPPTDDQVTVELTVRYSDDAYGPLVDAADARLLTPDSMGNNLWVQVEDDADEAAVVDQVETTLGALDPSERPYAYGAVVERVQIEEAIDTVIAVIVGLLAVSVVIALVGVTNTLSLSVIERRREIAMLRAVGMTRGGIRISMVLEGVLLAVVGAVIGAVAGIGLGWAGAWALLSIAESATLAVPWAGLGITLLIALVAGVLAAVLPTRAALKVSPVAALGAE